MSIEGGPRGNEGRIETGSGGTTDSEIVRIYGKIHKLYQSTDDRQQNLAMDFLMFFEGPTELISWWFQFHTSLGSTPEQAIQNQQWLAVSNAIEDTIIERDLKSL